MTHIINEADNSIAFHFLYVIIIKTINRRTNVGRTYIENLEIFFNCYITM